MRWRLLVAVLGLSIVEVASHAQGPLDGERLSTAGSSCDDAGFFASAGMVRFQLVQGRLCLDCPLHRKGSQNSEHAGTFESITVTADRGIPSLHYVYQTAPHHLTLSVQQANSMRMESWFPETGERSVLEQPEFGKVSWTHKQGDLQDRYEGTNLLHLRHANPQTFDLHFGLLIQRLLRGQSLQSLSDTTERIMLSQIEHESSIDEGRIRSCVEQLGADRRALRVAAERQLLTWGTPIIPCLHHMIDGDVDVEQRERMRLILKRLRPMIDDTPATLAHLLVNDRDYWSRIASRLSHDQLRLTNHHLVGFGVEPIAITEAPAHRIANAAE